MDLLSNESVNKSHEDCFLIGDQWEDFRMAWGVEVLSCWRKKEKFLLKNSEKYLREEMWLSVTGEKNIRLLELKDEISSCQWTARKICARRFSRWWSVSKISGCWSCSGSRTSFRNTARGRLSSYQVSKNEEISKTRHRWSVRDIWVAVITMKDFLGEK